MSDRLDLLEADQRWADAVPLCCTAIGEGAGSYAGKQITILHLDARDRPDVMDLPRMLSSENVGTIINIGWYFGNAGWHPDVRGLLTWEMSSPVACSFDVKLTARDLRPELQAIAENGLFAITTVWPCPGADQLATSNPLIIPTSYIKGLLMALAWTKEG